MSKNAAGLELLRTQQQLAEAVLELLPNVAETTRARAVLEQLISHSYRAFEVVAGLLPQPAEASGAAPDAPAASPAFLAMVNIYSQLSAAREVCALLESSILAFSAASFRRCRANTSLPKSTP